MGLNMCALDAVAVMGPVTPPLGVVVPEPLSKLKLVRALMSAYFA